MRNRLLAVVIALAMLVAVPCAVQAQNAPSGLVMGTTVTANVYGGQNYFFLILTGGNVTTFNLVNQNLAGTAQPFNPGIVTIIFQQDATGSRTVGFGTMFATAVIPTVFATASKTTLMQFFYDSATALWYPLSSVALHN